MTARRVAAGDTLQLRYALRLQNGVEIVSNLDDCEADTLTLGDGTLAPSLEHWLIGLGLGERHVFLLDAAQAFGTAQPELVQTVPRSALQNAPASLAPGSLVEFAAPDGSTLVGQIIELLDDAVRVDFNHPLAGLPIEFEVEITAFLDAPPIPASPRDPPWSKP